MQESAHREEGSKLLTFREMLPGILFLLPKLPRIFAPLMKARSLSLDDRLSLGTFLERNAENHPDERAILFEDQCHTHREFNETVNRYANHLLSLGVKKGEAIVAFLENRPEILFLIGAVSKIGAIVSLINPNQRGPVLLHSMNVTPSRLLIIGEELVDAFEDIKKELELGSDVDIYFLPDRGLKPAPDAYVDWQLETRDADSSNPSTTAEIRMRDPFAYLFTSGTTGMPKAAVTLHHRWVLPLHWFGKAMLDLGVRDTVYVPLPFYHGTAMYVGWPSAAAGGAAVALRRRFSASNFWKDVRKFDATAFVYIGELCRYLMQQPESPQDRKNSIRKIVGNGLRPDIWRDFKNRFDISEIYEFYGSSEGNLAFANLLNLDRTVGICPMPHAIVKYDVNAGEPIRGENGFLQKVGRGESGLVLGKISSKAPFFGYTDKKATEKKIIRNGFEEGDAWYDTGDLLRDIGFGHAQFVDRLGDTFRWKGENVSTTEVEAVVDSFDQVSASSVYGVAIPGTDGRAGMASVIVEKGVGDPDFKGLLDALRKGLPSYAVPLFIRLRAAFETTETLKIRKSERKNEGCDPAKVTDPLYVLLPGNSSYVPMTQALYEEIVDGKHRF
jgi:citronellyl-CoA synthetase